jgi:hypothetical protein
MKPVISRSFLDRLFAANDYDSLVQLSSFFLGTSTCRLEKADYGLPRPFFLIIESLVWFAQAGRSGAWTYFEATSAPRQQAMLDALTAKAPAGFAQAYATGIEQWRNEAKMAALDRWLSEHDDENNRWLWRLANVNREKIDELLS